MFAHGGLKIALAERDDEISHLNKANISTKEALEKLNKALHENSKKFKEEKAKLYKENRAELKSWKKHFGEANSQILKLEKKISDSAICISTTVSYSRSGRSISYITSYPISRTS